MEYALAHLEGKGRSFATCTAGKRNLSIAHRALSKLQSRRRAVERHLRLCAIEGKRHELSASRVGPGSPFLFFPQQALGLR
jgi:hypothetical protein